MPVLASQQRKILEDACTKGRRAAEQAVRAALTSLSITADRPPAHLNEDERQLRRGLRAKARQLGDTGNNLDLLVAECAYEQWHRLLFARFLAENNLLIHPDYHAPVTIEDCEELAEALGEPDGWSVAARFAAEILPGIFRLDDPCVRLRLTPEGRLALEGILASLPAEVFAADDALGWVYQFWQKDKKDEVNASERKIGGADLAPVTQLFTENYMVRFLLENSLGAWWAARHPDSPLVTSFDYLRFNDDNEPAAGIFERWPDLVAEVTVMDPCCGSGHFLVEAFGMLWRMRSEEEGLTPVDAQDAVLRDNLFGLELDPRCVQIAMFAVALQAWKAGSGWRELPVPNIACSGIPAKAVVDEWKALANGDLRLEAALARLHDLFTDAGTLGSLIDPKAATEATRAPQTSMDAVDWHTAGPALQSAAGREDADPSLAVLGAVAASAARVADFLARTFTLVATNVPWLKRGNQTDLLKRFADVSAPDARTDLATLFLARCRRLCPAGGTMATVSPQNWLTLGSYQNFRERMLHDRNWHIAARLGAGAFETISGEAVKPVLTVTSSSPPEESYFGIVCDATPTASAKAEILRSGALLACRQDLELANPDSRITFTGRLSPVSSLLAEVAASYVGIQTGDDPRYKLFFWELPFIRASWERLQDVPTTNAPWSGCSHIIRWENGTGALARDPGARLQGQQAWGHRGVAMARFGQFHASLYHGGKFHQNAAVIVPANASLVPAVLAFCQSDEFEKAVRRIDQKMNVTNASLVKVPFDPAKWRVTAEDRGPLPKPSSDDPTQWLFEGRPEVSAAPLQVAVARILGFRWPEQSDHDDLDPLADGDGIVCLPSVAGEAPAADRLQRLLERTFAAARSTGTPQDLLVRAGSKKKTLGDWLRDEFFNQHCALFGNRPFVWHIWDGQRDGFSALVNYHRLDRKTLEKLTYTYLGDWIERQQAERHDEKEGAEARLAAASKLRRALELILEGSRPLTFTCGGSRWRSNRSGGSLTSTTVSE